MTDSRPTESVQFTGKSFCKGSSLRKLWKARKVPSSFFLFCLAATTRVYVLIDDFSKAHSVYFSNCCYTHLYTRETRNNSGPLNTLIYFQGERGGKAIKGRRVREETSEEAEGAGEVQKFLRREETKRDLCCPKGKLLTL